MTQMENITNAIKDRLILVLPPEYKELAYVEDVEENNWNQIINGFGVRALEANEVSGVNKVYTLSQTFEVILTGRYLHSQEDDVRLRDISYQLRAFLLDIYRDLINNKAGLPLVVMNVSTLLIQPPEIDFESKNVIQRMEFLVLYRISL